MVTSGTAVTLKAVADSDNDSRAQRINQSIWLFDALRNTETMNEESRRIFIDVAKHLVTITVAAIGFMITLLFTTFKDTNYIVSAQVSLFSLLLCVVFSVLTQMAVIENALDEKPAVRWLYWSPKTLLTVAWTFLVVGITAFVVFTWANINR